MSFFYFEIAKILKKKKLAAAVMLITDKKNSICFISGK